MTPTLLTVFAISMLGAWFGQASPSRTYNVLGKRQPNLIGVFITLITVVLFSGLRNNIGDTVYYLHTYNLDTENGMDLPAIGDKAYLFQLFQYFLHQANAEPSVFIMICSILTLVPMIWLFYKYSADYTLSIFLFFTMGIFASTLNGIRQYVATGLILLGSKFLFSPKKTDFWKYLILILIASQIHSSAVIMIPLYFLCRRKAWSAPAMISVAAGVAGLIFVSMFLPSFLTLLEDTSYSTYADGWFDEGGSTGGANILRVAFNIMPTVLAAIFSKQVRQFGPVADILINISLVHSAIYILALYDWIFARFAFYTYAYVILLMALVFVAVLRSGKYRFFSFLLFGAYIIYFIIDARANRLNWYASDFFTPNNTMLFKFLYLN